MKLILSRKGFDSSSGGCPSPVFPDGAMLSLPIPDKSSDIRYSALARGETNLGQLVADLTCAEKRRNHFAHLDPDLDPDALLRAPGWRPLLGQTGRAQGHLRKQKVGAGSLFLFFGLYRRVEKNNGKWRFVKSSRQEHVLWGWLQVGAVYKVQQLSQGELDWAEYHPHFRGERGPENTLYEATDNLRINGKSLDIPGAGIFSRYNERLVLTEPEPNRYASKWQLPSSFFPSPGKPPLSHFPNLKNWRLSEAGDYCLVSRRGPGQEFVLDLEHYPKVMDWLEVVLTLAPAHQL